MEETISDIKSELTSKLKGKKVALVGIGSLEKGDDGFGIRMVQQLKSRLKNTSLFECGTAPENYLGPIIKSRPQVVLIIDAANLGAEPGHIHIIEEEDIATLGVSTHDTSLKLFINYLKNSLRDLNIFLLGIQPKQTGLGKGVSKELEQLLSELGKVFLEILS